ncbi:hypothetical protein [Salinibius halmophilus]|uniref:hypothetical protein n=1 Tax=Salinibius halmophilus TaxID=1853216 RepID=UPI000E6662DD|nr:hypothetical protein [Salinibius halmophilus]
MSQNALVWLPVEEAIESVPCTCIDGRTKGMRYSAAGGSFAIALHIIANVMPNATDAEIENALLRFSQHVGPLYYHTDEAALRQWLCQSGIHPELDLHQLDAKQQEQLLASADMSAHVGCGHVQLMLNNPEKYLVPKHITAAGIRAFFRLWFANTPRVTFEALAGEHQESQALFIESVDGAAQQTPLRSADEEVFFCHRPLKRALFDRYCQILGVASEAGRLFEQHNMLAEHTLHTLAPHLPKSHLNVGVQS